MCTDFGGLYCVVGNELVNVPKFRQYNSTNKKLVTLVTMPEEHPEKFMTPQAVIDSAFAETPDIHWVVVDADQYYAYPVFDVDVFATENNLPHLEFAAMLCGLDTFDSVEGWAPYVSIATEDVHYYGEGNPNI